MTKSSSHSARNYNEYVRESKRARTVSPSPSRQCHPQQLPASSNSIDPIMSVIETMKRQESVVYRPFPYLEGAGVTEQDRKMMCQWGFSMADACQVDRYIGSIAITYFDRFLSMRGVPSVEVCLANQRELQLAFITCFTIALKVRGGINVTSDFIADHMSEGLYHAKEFVNMEVEILRTLEWRLNGPTPHDFIRLFVELLPKSTAETVTKFLVEEATKSANVAMMDYSLAMQPFSYVALLALFPVATTLDMSEQCQLDILCWMNTIRCVLGDATAAAVEHEN